MSAEHQQPNTLGENLLSQVVPQVEAFLTHAEGKRMYRSWIETDIMSVYLRKSKRLLSGVMRQCLDIAAIEIEEGYQQQGLFSQFMLKVHELHPYEATYIEPVGLH